MHQLGRAAHSVPFFDTSVFSEEHMTDLSRHVKRRQEGRR
jgi:hypothetical protein